MYTKERQIAGEIMRHAAQMTEQIRRDRSKPSAIWKPDDSPVTIADFAVQALLAANRGIVAGVISAHTEAIRALSVDGKRPD